MAIATRKRQKQDESRWVREENGSLTRMISQLYMYIFPATKRRDSSGAEP